MAPTIDGANVAFFVAGGGGQQGIYRAAIGGSLTTVADKNIAIPGGTGSFTSFIPPNLVAPAIKGASVAFFGAGSSGQRRALPLDANGAPLAPEGGAHRPGHSGTGDTIQGTLTDALALTSQFYRVQQLP